jgi:hypothetical protein
MLLIGPSRRFVAMQRYVVSGTQWTLASRPPGAFIGSRLARSGDFNMITITTTIALGRLYPPRPSRAIWPAIRPKTSIARLTMRSRRRSRRGPSTALKRAASSIAPWEFFSDHDPSVGTNFARWRVRWWRRLWLAGCTAGPHQRLRGCISSSMFCIDERETAKSASASAQR